MDYFQFKNFLVYHNNSPQKVTTDSIILGSWVIKQPPTKNILDIGAGNGILSLMMAQKFPDALIEAIEINPEASKDALKSFNLSNWSRRLNLLNQDINLFKPSNTYDLIISNPPYFSKSIPSKVKEKETARHQTELTTNQIFKFSNIHLNSTGQLYMVLPYLNLNLAIQEAKTNNLYLAKQLTIKTKPNSPPKIACLNFSRSKEETKKNELIIHEEKSGYSTAYKELTKEFYAHKL